MGCSSGRGGTPSSSTVEELVRKEVSDWDDEVVSFARFKAFSGQRSDWEHRYFFWRDVILKIAKALGICTINVTEVKNVWFVRAGLTPLCIDQVLLEMYNSGDIVLKSELIDPTSGQFSQMIKRFYSLVGLSRRNLLLNEGERCVILKSLLQDRAECIIKVLSESHWTNHFIITMERLQLACKDPDEAYAILSYWTQYGKAKYFSIRKMDFIEGIKVSLAQTSVSGISTFDYDILQLVWTTERLQKQLGLIDNRWLTSRKLAIMSIKTGNKVAAYRYIRQAKLFAESRKKCTSFLERVEEMISFIFNLDMTRKVSNAIEIGAHMMKKNEIKVEEIYQNLEEIKNTITLQEEVADILGFSSLSGEDDFEEEFRNIEEELDREDLAKRVLDVDEAKPEEHMKSHQFEEDALSNDLSRLNLEARDC